MNASLSHARLLVVLHAVGLSGGAWAQDVKSEPSPAPAPGDLTLEASALVPEPLTGRIEYIELRGNTRTQDSVILRALRMAPGEVSGGTCAGTSRPRVSIAGCTAPGVR